MSYTYTANAIKALLIDYIENNKLIENCVYGNELFYGTKKRQTDLLAVNGYTTAFEIKSKSDDFRKMREQLDDYKKVFDFQYLVVHCSHEQKALKFLKSNEGFIVLNDNGQLIIKKQPKIIVKQCKIEVLNTIPLSFLKKHFKLGKKYNTGADVRKHLQSYLLDDLKSAMRAFLKQRLIPRNQAFREEKGIVTHFEDLKFLVSFPDRII